MELYRLDGIPTFRLSTHPSVKTILEALKNVNNSYFLSLKNVNNSIFFIIKSVIISTFKKPPVPFPSVLL